MGRVVRVLLVFAVVMLSAAPGPGSGSDIGSPSSFGVSDPSQQLSSRLPIARTGGAKLSGVDDGGLCDRLDQRIRHVPAAVLPGAVVASRVAVCEPVGEPMGMRVGTVATCACGRGPPRVSLLTSI